MMISLLTLSVAKATTMDGSNQVADFSTLLFESKNEDVQPKGNLIAEAPNVGSVDDYKLNILQRSLRRSKVPMLLIFGVLFAGIALATIIAIVVHFATRAVAVGGNCTKDSDCTSNSCKSTSSATKKCNAVAVGVTCTQDSDCTSNSCKTSSTTKKCKAVAVGVTCTQNSDCETKKCDASNNKCAEPTACVGKGDIDCICGASSTVHCIRPLKCVNASVDQGVCLRGCAANGGTDCLCGDDNTHCHSGKKCKAIDAQTGQCLPSCDDSNVGNSADCVCNDSSTCAKSVCNGGSNAGACS